MTTVVGLDISLAGTGAAVVTHTVGWSVHTQRFPTSPKTGDLPELLGRMRHVRDRCADIAANADLVVVEEQAFGAKGSAARSLAGVWYFVVDRILRMEIPVITVATGTLKKYATGAGNVDKREVSRGVGRMWPDVATGSGDEDDALTLASIGGHLMGMPVPYLITAYREEIAGNLALPDGVSA